MKSIRLKASFNAKEKWLGSQSLEDGSKFHWCKEDVWLRSNSSISHSPLLFSLAKKVF